MQLVLLLLLVQPQTNVSDPLPAHTSDPGLGAIPCHPVAQQSLPTFLSLSLSLFHSAVYPK